jgi:BirA family biotin operon repressor/biotin-[acetyl-CoA-carboxylase] ligase
MQPIHMKSLTYRVLQSLAAGEFRSGEALAGAMGVSRGSVWHAVRELEQAGLAVYRVRGRGYRLEEPVSLLDAETVKSCLGAQARGLALEFLATADSTNTVALQRARDNAPSGTLIAAEWQAAGRGRHGRAWHAGLAGGLTFSLVWRFTQGAAALSGLSLAVGVALVRAMQSCGATEVALKWPNDVVWRGSKLAGILIEMQGDALGPACVVIGVGINVHLSRAVRERIDQPVTDMETACGSVLDRNAVLARVLIELKAVLTRFEREGLGPLRAEWQRYHVWQERPVTVTLPDGRSERGVARGVDEGGALIVSTTAGVRHYHSGEVSLRSRRPTARPRVPR